MTNNSGPIGLPRPDRIRWLFITFGFLATVLNYVHRLSFNYLSAEGELRGIISDEAFGYIGTAFFVAYTISNAVSGYVIDKLGTKLGYALVMAFWTTAGLFHAFVITPFQFGIVRFMLGMGEAGNWPAGTKLAREWFPPHERSTAMGIFNSGSALGAVVVAPLVAILGVSFGWRATFVILGALGYIWLVAWWFTYYTPEQSGKDIKKIKDKVISPVILFKTRFLARFTLSKVFLDPVWYFVTFWIGRYLVDVHGWNLKQIGWFAALPFIIADIGNIAGGYFTQFIIKKGVPIPKARMLALNLSVGIMAVTLLAAPFITHSPMTALIIFGFTGFGYTSYTANALAVPSDVVPSSATATVWGLACIGTGFGGAIFQSVSGLTLKAMTVNHDYASSYDVLFIMFGVMAVIGMIIQSTMGPLVKNKTLEEYVKSNVEH
ncbi:MAG TPA: MFS transporter [Draconibacterium sp.]|nr:MFS transporter [Draconibacterium sp.]